VRTAHILGAAIVLHIRRLAQQGLPDADAELLRSSRPLLSDLTGPLIRPAMSPMAHSALAVLEGFERVEPDPAIPLTEVLKRVSADNPAPLPLQDDWSWILAEH
jgi:hypothetical protein